MYYRLVNLEQFRGCFVFVFPPPPSMFIPFWRKQALQYVGWFLAWIHLKSSHDLTQSMHFSRKTTEMMLCSLCCVTSGLTQCQPLPTLGISILMTWSLILVVSGSFLPLKFTFFSSGNSYWVGRDSKIIAIPQTLPTNLSICGQFPTESPSCDGCQMGMLCF